MAVVDDGVARLLESLSSADVSDLALRERIEVVVDIAWSCYSSPTSMAAFEILRATRGGAGRQFAQAPAGDERGDQQLGRLISDDPADRGVAEVIWATLRGMVLAQMIMDAPIDWQRERRALVEMARTYLQRSRPGDR